jgi:hypothetical protein
MTHAIPWPLLDTAFAPALLVALIDSAAVLGLLAIVRRGERSIVSMVAFAVASLLALYGTAILVLHAIFPD